MEKELKVSRSSERPRRTSVGQRNRLNLRNREPGYQYRLVNANLESDPDRVQSLIDQGYEIVPGQKAGPAGDVKVDTPSAIGSAGLISVGQGTKGVWMRIREDWFKEDQAAKQAEIDATEQRTQKQGADYGKVEVSVTRG
jgi:hypothetical protein